MPHGRDDRDRGQATPAPRPTAPSSCATSRSAAPIPWSPRLDGYEPKQAVVQPRDGSRTRSRSSSPRSPRPSSLDSQPERRERRDRRRRRSARRRSTLTHARRRARPCRSCSRRPGYQDATAKLEVPGPGKETQLIQPLAVSADLARIKVDVGPAGRAGRAERPAARGRHHAGRGARRGRQARAVHADDAEQGPRRDRAVHAGARRRRRSCKHGKLVDGTLLNVTSNLDGKATVGRRAALPGPPRSPPSACSRRAPTTIDAHRHAADAAGRLPRRLAVGAEAINENIDFGYRRGAARTRCCSSARARRAARACSRSGRGESRSPSYPGSRSRPTR